MKYTTPKIGTVTIEDILMRLGPARAEIYTPGDVVEPMDGGKDGGGKGGSKAGG